MHTDHCPEVEVVKEVTDLALDDDIRRASTAVVSGIVVPANALDHLANELPPPGAGSGNRGAAGCMRGLDCVSIGLRR